MCPLCIGSALLALTGAGSAGGLALIVARAAGAGTAPRAPGSLIDASVGHRHRR